MVFKIVVVIFLSFNLLVFSGCSGGKKVDVPDKSKITKTASSPAVKKTSTTSLGYVVEGINLVRQNKHQEAEESFKMAIKLDDKNAEAYNGIGFLYLNQKKYKEAEENLKKAIELRGNFANAYVNLAGCYYSQKKYDQAVEAYKKVIELNPSFAIAYYNIAVIYALQGKKNDSITYLKKAAELDYRAKQSAKKQNYFDKMKDSPEFKEFLKETEEDYIGEALFNLKHIKPDTSEEERKKIAEKTMPLIRKAMQKKPDYAKAYFAEGICYMIMTKKDNAIKSLNHAIKLKPDFAEAYYQLAVIYFINADNTSAETNARKVISLAPESDTALRTYYLLTILYQKKQDIQKSKDAKDKYEKLLKKFQVN